MNTKTNPPISQVLRILTFIEFIVLFLAGVLMFFLPALVVPFWPWELLPFNARFLGAVYSAACFAALIQTIYSRWSPARLVTPMIFIFTFIIILLSFIHINIFDFSRWETYVWLFLYTLLPVNAAYHMWLYRHLPPANSTTITNSNKKILLTQTIIFGLYGAILLIAPAIAKSIWSWDIDDFHAQVYSVTFITPALGAYILTKGASKLEWQTMGITQLILGIFPILGVLIVDASAKRVNWYTPETFIWLILFSLIAGLGIWMLLQSQKE